MMKFEEMKTQEDLDSYVNSAIEEANKGLAAKVDELLSEKKAEAAKRKEAEKARQDAEEAAKERQLEAAKAAGQIEEVEKALEERYSKQMQDLQAKLETRDNEILTGHKNVMLESLSSRFTSPEAARLMLSNMIETTRGEEGLVNNFKGLDGSVVTTDANKFVEYLSSQDSFKPLLKGVDSSGGGATGNGSASGAGIPSKDDVKGRLEARLQKSGVIN